MPKTVRNYFSPYTADSLKDYLQSSSLTLATCWKLIPKTGSLNANVALNSTVNASSTYASSEYDPSFIVNGDRVGSPSGEFGWRNAVEDNFPQTVTLDFGVVKDIQEVDIYSAKYFPTEPLPPSVPDPVLRVDARDYSFLNGALITSLVETGSHGYTMTGGSGSLETGPFFINQSPKKIQYTDMSPSAGFPFTNFSSLHTPAVTNTDLSLNGNWTITFILEVPGTASYGQWGHLFRRYGAGGGWEIYGDSLDGTSYTIGLYWEDATTNFDYITTFTPTRAAEVITITSDGTDIKFYQNSALVETVSIASGGFGTPNPNPPPSITAQGAFSNPNALFGYLSYFAIWDSELDITERNTVEADLLCYWKNSGCFNTSPMGLIVDFDVEYWDGTTWILLPSGSITGNVKEHIQFLFSTISTDKIRITVNEAFRGFSIINEVEVFAGNIGLGATSHTSNLTLQGHPGVLFRTRQGLIPSAADTEAGLSSAGLEIDAIFDDVLISEESVAAGHWNSAYFEVFLVNYKALDMGEYVIFAGFIGDVQTAGFRFRAEGRPLTARSLQQAGLLTSQNCRVRQLGDKDCKVNLNAPALGDGGVITVTGTVTTGGSSDTFTDSGRTEANRYFEHGIIEFTSGDLTGRQAEIKTFSGGVFELQEPMTREIAVGTTYKAIRGCNRTPQMCTSVYDNIVNFRGFPVVPGLEKAYRVKPEIQV